MMKMIWVSHHGDYDDDDGDDDEDEQEESYDDINNSNEIDDYNHIDDGNKIVAEKVFLRTCISIAENMQQRLQRKKAWRRKINFFTGKRFVIKLINLIILLICSTYIRKKT